MDTIGHSIILRFCFPSREARGWLESHICEFAWILKDGIRVERAFPKLLSTLPHQKLGEQGSLRRTPAQGTGSFATGSRENTPSFSTPEWSLLFFLQDWIKCILCSDLPDKERIYQQRRGKTKMVVQRSIHVRVVHLQGFQESSCAPNPFRRCLYLSLLGDNPLNGIFKKSDINHQPFISPEDPSSIGRVMADGAYVYLHTVGGRCLCERMLPCF